jgi:hypothetical protein
LKASGTLALGNTPHDPDRAHIIKHCRVVRKQFYKKYQEYGCRKALPIYIRYKTVISVFYHAREFRALNRHPNPPLKLEGFPNSRQEQSKFHVRKNLNSMSERFRLSGLVPRGGTKPMPPDLAAAIPDGGPGFRGDADNRDAPE